MYVTLFDRVAQEALLDDTTAKRYLTNGLTKAARTALNGRLYAHLE